MYIITDLEGREIKISDIDVGIAMVKGFLSYTRKETIPSLRRLEEHRILYWQDIYNKLIALQERLNNSKH